MSEQRTPEHVPTVEEMAAWITDRTGLSPEVVDAVLLVEYEYSVGIGLIHDPDHVFELYEEGELTDEEVAAGLDEGQIIADVAHFFDVTTDQAGQVLDAKLAHLDSLGLVTYIDDES